MEEITQESHKVWWDNQAGFLRVELIGNMDEVIAQKVADTTDKLFKEHGEKSCALIDLRKTGKVSSRAREIFGTLTAHPLNYKLAFIVNSIFIKTLVNFVMLAVGKVNSKQFTNEAEAIEWLKM